MKKITLERLLYKNYLKTSLVSIFLIELFLVFFYFIIHKNMINKSSEFLLNDVQKSISLIIENNNQLVDKNFTRTQSLNDLLSHFIEMKLPYKGKIIIINNLGEILYLDENLKNYGYEDLIFSKNLELKKVEISHLENPVLHGDEETTDVFLFKTKIAIQNLRKIHKYNPDFVRDMKLIKAYQKIKDKRLLSVYKNFFKISKSFLINKLHQENPNLRYFDLYKLGLFIEKHN